jgi:hypothetical protein
MKSIKTFEAFLNEEEEDKKKAGEETPAEDAGPTIDPDKEKIKDFEISGKTYKGVLSTFEAIGQKQKAMGVSEVGVLSLPGDEAAYELFAEEESKETGSEE